MTEKRYDLVEMFRLTVSDSKDVYYLKDNFLACRCDLYITAIPPPFLFSMLWMSMLYPAVSRLYILVLRFIAILCPCFCNKAHVNDTELHMVYEHIYLGFKRLYVYKYYAELSRIPKGLVRSV